jgi:hypothetical protein
MLAHKRPAQGLALFDLYLRKAVLELPIRPHWLQKHPSPRPGRAKAAGTTGQRQTRQTFDLDDHVAQDPSVLRTDAAGSTVVLSEDESMAALLSDKDDDEEEDEDDSDDDDDEEEEDGGHAWRNERNQDRSSSWTNDPAIYATDAMENHIRLQLLLLYGRLHQANGIKPYVINGYLSFYISIYRSIYIYLSFYRSIYRSFYISFYRRLVTHVFWPIQ